MAIAQQGGNVFNTSANAYNGAVNATGAAMAQNAMTAPMMAQTTTATAQGYNPFTGLNADGTAMAGFGAGTASGGGYTADQAAAARDVMAGQLANTDLSVYMNPYTDNVINQTQADMERARLIAQNQADDAAQAAGAFGGSRHGIANAETNRNYYDMLGSTVGDLRNQGFQNAQQAALTDIGNTMQADFANQQSDLSTNQFNANAVNTARQTGANNATSASIANANAETQLANSRFNAVNNALQFGANAQNNVNQFNAGMETDTSRFNAGTFNDAVQSRFNNQLSGAAQLSGLSGQGFNMGNTAASNADNAGQQVVDQQQQLIDDARQQFLNYINAGNLGLGQLQSGVSAAPSGAGSTTQTSNPGLLGVLGAFL